MLMGLTLKLASLATALVRSLLSRSAASPRLTPALLALPPNLASRLLCSLRSPPRLLLASLALPALLASLAPRRCCARSARRLPAARSARRLPAARSARRLACCSRFARHLACGCSLRSPLRLRLLASLAGSPARSAHRLTRLARLACSSIFCAGGQDLRNGRSTNNSANRHGQIQKRDGHKMSAIGSESDPGIRSFVRLYSFST